MTFDSPPNLPTGPLGDEARLTSAIQRIERVLDFAEEVGTAVADDRGFDADVVPRLEALTARIQEGRAYLQSLSVLPPAERLDAASAWDSQGLLEAAQELQPARNPSAYPTYFGRPPERASTPPAPLPAVPESREAETATRGPEEGELMPWGEPPARVVPPMPAARPRGTGPLSPLGAEGRGTGGLGATSSAPARGGGLLGALGLRPAAPKGTGPLGSPLNAGAPSATGPLPATAMRPGSGRLHALSTTGSPVQARPQALDRAILAFTAARTLAAEVLAFVSPRLTLVQVSLTATGLPGRRRPWTDISADLVPRAEEAGVATQQMLWLPLLVKLFYEDARALQAGHVALTNWQQAQRLHGAADRLAASLETAPSVSHLQLLSAFHLGKYRAAAYALSHLHAGFAGLPHLSVLFPPPETTTTQKRPG